MVGCEGGGKGGNGKEGAKDGGGYSGSCFEEGGGALLTSINTHTLPQKLLQRDKIQGFK